MTTTSTDGPPLLDVTGLRVSYATARGHVPALHGVDLRVAAGETVALVGESGSGKSTLAHAVIGLLPANARVDGGSVRFAPGGRDGEPRELLGASERTLRGVRGAGMGLVPQDPTVSLNPVQRIGPQVEEVLRTHGLADRRTVAAAAVAVLERAGLPDAATRARQHPHELSGGLRQRVLTAIAIAGRPRLLIADEPTSALDVTVQRVILDHLEELAAADGLGVLLVTHDLGVAADRAQRLVVMSGGRVVEAGPTAQVLADPQHDYTRTLLAAAPGLHPRRRVTATAAPAPALVEVAGLGKRFPLPRTASGPREVVAVDDVSFTVPRGRTLALVGESGSGKTTTARMVLGLARPGTGTVTFDGRDVTGLRGRPWRELRRRAQLVYQNPFTSLDPRFTVAESVVEPLAVHRVGDRAERRRRAAELVDRVALPADVLDRRPAELSGGQRQRVAIARALALSPDLVVLDEPVSALDVSVQAHVLELLVELQTDQELTYLLISHDLAVVAEVAHDVGVMRAGRLVEMGPAEALLAAPQHEYTRSLLAAVAGTRAPAGAP